MLIHVYFVHFYLYLVAKWKIWSLQRSVVPQNALKRHLLFKCLDISDFMVWKVSVFKAQLLDGQQSQDNLCIDWKQYRLIDHLLRLKWRWVKSGNFQPSPHYHNLCKILGVSSNNVLEMMFQPPTQHFLFNFKLNFNEALILNWSLLESLNPERVAVGSLFPF